MTYCELQDPGASLAKVVSISQLSSTVKGLTLQLEEKEAQGLHFQAGQWLDFFIPGEEKVKVSLCQANIVATINIITCITQVGGFSMCSCPTDLTTKRTVDLAVKFSTWAPAYWVHTQCKVGDMVTFR